MSVSWNDFEWVLTKDSLPSTGDQTLWTICNTYDVAVLGIDYEIPKLQRSIVDIPYRNGSVDVSRISDAYDNRKVSLRLESKGTILQGLQAFRACVNEFHGKLCYVLRIISANHPSIGYDPFFYGRVSVTRFDQNGGTFSFSIDMDAFPYNHLQLPQKELIEVYDATITKTISASSKYEKLFVACEFDGGVTNTGLTLVGNYGRYITNIYPTQGSGSVYNPNMFIMEPYVSGGVYRFVLAITAINPAVGELNDKFMLRYLRVEL